MPEHKRSILRIQLDLASKARLDRLCDQRGMTQIAVMSRLVTWFVTQNEVIQIAVLGLLSPKHTALLAKQVLQELDDAPLRPEPA